MLKEIKSSIIIPFYNGEEFIFKTLASIYGQTILPDEIIIVNDGSTLQKSISVLEGVKQKYKNIKIIQQQNKGISGAMTVGTKSAIGDIIFQVDCDDILDLYYIERYLNIFLKNNEIDAVTCYYGSFFDGKDYTQKENLHHIYKPRGLDVPYIFFENCAGGANSAFRKTTLEKIGYWDEVFTSFQDWGLWLKFVQHNLLLHIIPEILYFYRIHDLSDLHMGAKTFEVERHVITSVQNIIKGNPKKFADTVYPTLHKVAQKGVEAEKIEKQIKLMKNSHFWKIRDFYMKLMRKNEK